MDMEMWNRLACSRSIVDTYIVTIWLVLSSNILFGLIKQLK